MEPTSFRGTAFNQATESENEIHSDQTARRYGFRGGLVPGVTVHAYLAQPAIVAWGEDFLARGGAEAVLREPLYDGEAFRVEVEPKPGQTEFTARLLAEGDRLCAESTVWLRNESELPAPPTPRGAPTPPAFDERPVASRAQLEALAPDGLGRLDLTWNADVELTQTSRDLADMPDLIRQDRGGFATPAFTLGLANWVLTRSVRLGPWIHVQSRVQHFAPVALGERLFVEATICDLFEKRGHEFVDLDVCAFREHDESPVLQADHRAIYVLRER